MDKTTEHLTNTSQAIIKIILERGYVCDVICEEEGDNLLFQVDGHDKRTFSDNYDVIIEAIESTGFVGVNVFELDTTTNLKEYIGWVQILLGNEPWEDICDSSTNDIITDMCDVASELVPEPDYFFDDVTAVKTR